VVGETLKGGVRYYFITPPFAPTWAPSLRRSPNPLLLSYLSTDNIHGEGNNPVTKAETPPCLLPVAPRMLLPSTTGQYSRLVRSSCSTPPFHLLHGLLLFSLSDHCTVWFDSLYLGHGNACAYYSGLCVYATFQITHNAQLLFITTFPQRCDLSHFFCSLYIAGSLNPDSSSTNGSRNSNTQTTILPGMLSDSPPIFNRKRATSKLSLIALATLTPI